MAGEQLDFLGFTVFGPPDALFVQLDVCVFRKVNDIPVGFINGVALGLEVDRINRTRDQAVEGLVHFFKETTETKILAEVVTGEGEGTAGMLLLRETVKVGGESNLGLHLFFAVPEVIISDGGDHPTGGIAAGDFKCAAFVVEFVFFFPAHSVAFLTLGCLGDLREPEFFLGGSNEVRRENDATGMPGPMLGVESGIVARKEGVASIAEDRLNEIEIADEIARRKEAHLQSFFADEALYFGDNNRPQ